MKFKERLGDCIKCLLPLKTINRWEMHRECRKKVCPECSLAFSQRVDQDRCPRCRVKRAKRERSKQ